MKILSTEQVVTWTERRAYRSALAVLLGRDLGSKVGRWVRHWTEHAAALLEERAGSAAGGKAPR